MHATLDLCYATFTPHDATRHDGRVGSGSVNLVLVGYIIKLNQAIKVLNFFAHICCNFIHCCDNSVTASHPLRRY